MKKRLLYKFQVGDIKKRLASIIDKLWYTYHPWRWFFLPFSFLYQCITLVRRLYLQQYRQQHFSVPIIVVGNLTVGGVGKTPLVIALAKQFQSRGVRVGIVSRGYGSRLHHYPYEVSIQDKASMVGDEPLLIAQKTGCPVVIAPKRNSAVNYLLQHYQCELIISDDGLQHYAMGRAIEMVVIDGVRGLGNECCLPAGPLRESKRRLQEIDFLIINGKEGVNAYRMDLLPGEITQLSTGEVLPLSALNRPVAAVAGIGNPHRFFETLKKMGLDFNPYPFPDHYSFTEGDFSMPEKTVVMTEKDGVKCIPFATQDMYVLPVEARLSSSFWDALWSHKQLQGLAGCLLH